ncbi:serine/threonine protein kinase [Telmatocola sphagniphila]|uniref:Serine/threonine protein kinase n=1 Tax=Telmatocola sphagniphila TaxID=1123043 RepID=A0A8E6EWH8_9BACT|nr:serine/threonine-protein kinase [Telmatocola sphagniphila]QVL34000.1 serine/threonine protein kinase [Telmatocola sphagniphila]
MSEAQKKKEQSDIFAISRSDLAASTLNAPTKVEQVSISCSSQRFRPGERFNDFVILRELGRGGFATVYLAHDVTLDRRVALKVSETLGLGEGQALAELEHQNIVQVYGQFINVESGKHCLCLQYVPGVTLAHVIEHLHKNNRRPVQGIEILESITIDSNEEIPFDLAGIRNREILATYRFAAAICRISVQMAEALEFAHRRGVLHCDIKPANILINPYGRPLLADFNIAIDTQDVRARNHLGGTIGYMAPEHLGAYLKEPGFGVVDERSDLYSLGVVLYELLTGRMPFDKPATGDPRTDKLQLLQNQKSFSVSSCWVVQELPPVVERILRRCLDPEPTQRYQTAGELAGALANASDALAIEERLPSEGLLTAWVERNPFLALFLLTLLPQMIGSFVNIAYNTIEVRLDPPQHRAFEKIVLGYNLFVYPICLFIMFRLLRPIVRGWRRLSESAIMDGSEVDLLRFRVLKLGTWGIILALAGWLPGGLVFPIFIDVIAGGVSGEVYFHFLVSFTLSGLIAVIYSHFGIQFVVLRVFYPRLTNADTRTPTTLAAEMVGASRWLAVFQSLAAVIPLVGAVLLVVITGEMTLSFRLLVTCLIVLGMLGVGIAFSVTKKLTLLLRLLGSQKFNF